MANFLIGTVLSVGAGLASGLFRRNQSQGVERGKQEDFQQPRSSYGDYIAQVWGRGRIGSTLFWAKFPPREESETTTEGGGGKGGAGRGVSTTTFSYFGSFAVLLAEELTRIREIRFNGDLVWSNGEWDEFYSSNGAEVRFYLGTDTQDVDPLLETELGGQTEPPIPYRHRAYLVFESIILEKLGNNYPQVSVYCENGQNPDLADVLEDLLKQTKYLTAADYDISEATGEIVRGFQITRDESIAESLQYLLLANNLDLIDGTKLKVQKKLRPLVAMTVDEADLAVVEGNENWDELYQETRSDPSGLPSQVETRFFSQNRNGLQDVRRSPRFAAARHESIEVFDYPGILNSEKAETIANIRLWLMWQRSTTLQLRLPLWYWPLEAGDVIEVPVNGRLQQYQIQQIEYASNKTLLLTLWRYRAAIFDFSSTTGLGVIIEKPTTPSPPEDEQPISILVISVTGSEQTYIEGEDYTVGPDGSVTPVIGGGINNNTQVTITNVIGETTTAIATQGTPIDVVVPDVLQVVAVLNADTQQVYIEGTDYTVDLTTNQIIPLNGGAIAPGTPLIIQTEVSEPESPDSPLPTQPTDTDLRVLESPKAFDSDPAALYLFGNGPDAWTNAQVFISRNTEFSYEFVGQFPGRSDFGTAETVLSADAIASLDVTFSPYTELASVPIEDIDNGKNRFLVGNEILGAQSINLLGADSEGNRRYRLSNLVRGLQGTQSEIYNHQPDEAVYYLSGSRILAPISSIDVGKTLYFKALTLGQTLADVTPVTITVQGLTLDEAIPIDGGSFTVESSIILVNPADLIIEEDVCVEFNLCP